MNSGLDLTYFFWQLSYHGPTMFVCAVATFFAFRYHYRSRSAAILTLLGAAIMVIVPLIATTIQFIAFHQRSQNPGTQQLAQWLQAIGLAASFGRGVGMALWATAIFIDRPDTPKPEDRYLREEST